jgi:hypothetical protein
MYGSWLLQLGIGLIIGIVCIYYFTCQYRDKTLGGSITYGRAVGFGFVINMISSILGMIFNQILTKVIDPGIIQKQLVIARERAIAGGISEEQFDRGMEMQRNFNPIIGIIIGIIVMAFVAIILSLIIAIFTKKEDNSFDTAMQGVTQTEQ